MLHSSDPQVVQFLHKPEIADEGFNYEGVFKDPSSASALEYGAQLGRDILKSVERGVYEDQNSKETPFVSWRALHENADENEIQRRLDSVNKSLFRATGRGPAANRSRIDASYFSAVGTQFSGADSYLAALPGFPGGKASIGKLKRQFLGAGDDLAAAWMFADKHVLKRQRLQDPNTGTISEGYLPSAISYSVSDFMDVSPAPLPADDQTFTQVSLVQASASNAARNAAILPKFKYRASSDEVRYLSSDVPLGGMPPPAARPAPTTAPEPAPPGPAPSEPTIVPPAGAWSWSVADDRLYNEVLRARDAWMDNPANEEVTNYYASLARSWNERMAPHAADLRAIGKKFRFEVPTRAIAPPVASVLPSPPEAPRTPPEAPRTPPEAPRTPPEAPHTPPEAPRTPPEAPRTQPEAPQTGEIPAPIPAPEAPQTGQIPAPGPAQEPGEGPTLNFDFAGSLPMGRIVPEQYRQQLYQLEQLKSQMDDFNWGNIAEENVAAGRALIQRYDGLRNQLLAAVSGMRTPTGADAQSLFGSFYASGDQYAGLASRIQRGVGALTQSETNTLDATLQDRGGLDSFLSSLLALQVTYDEYVNDPTAWDPGRSEPHNRDVERVLSQYRSMSDEAKQIVRERFGESEASLARKLIVNQPVWGSDPPAPTNTTAFIGDLNITRGGQLVFNESSENLTYASFGPHREYSGRELAEGILQVLRQMQLTKEAFESALAAGNRDTNMHSYLYNQLYQQFDELRTEVISQRKAYLLTPEMMAIQSNNVADLVNFGELDTWAAAVPRGQNSEMNDQLDALARIAAEWRVASASGKAELQASFAGARTRLLQAIAEYESQTGRPAPNRFSEIAGVSARGVEAFIGTYNITTTLPNPERMRAALRQLAEDARSLRGTNVVEPLQAWMDRANSIRAELRRDYRNNETLMEFYEALIRANSPGDFLIRISGIPEPPT
jgi:hypothetical protein